MSTLRLYSLLRQCIAFLLLEFAQNNIWIFYYTSGHTYKNETYSFLSSVLTFFFSILNYIFFKISYTACVNSLWVELFQFYQKKNIRDESYSSRIGYWKIRAPQKQFSQLEPNSYYIVPYIQSYRTSDATRYGRRHNSTDSFYLQSVTSVWVPDVA